MRAFFAGLAAFGWLGGAGWGQVALRPPAQSTLMDGVVAYAAPQTTAEGVLEQMTARAAVIFCGVVTAVRLPEDGLSGVVEVEAAWGIVAVSGGGQTAAVGGVFDPVVARVVDGAGHGVAGVVVTVRQVVRGYVECPATGRCPVGPVLGSATGTVTTDGDGLVSATPLVVPGVGETTGMVLTAGDNGYWSTALSMVP